MSHQLRKLLATFRLLYPTGIFVICANTWNPNGFFIRPRFCESFSRAADSTSGPCPRKSLSEIYGTLLRLIGCYIIRQRVDRYVTRRHRARARHVRELMNERGAQMRRRAAARLFLSGARTIISDSRAIANAAYRARGTHDLALRSD